ncbi:MAG: DUF554 domain-containing protein [Eubacteriales bacterium]|nr:DUF554 domain-containing protein [Eubacteriales bacterium]
MIGTGTLVNMAAIIVGGGIGLAVRGGLPERIRRTTLSAIGLAVLVLGISGSLVQMFKLENGALTSTQGITMILALVIGSLIGGALNIEQRLENLGAILQKLFRVGDHHSTFVEGFVSATILYCVGAMAILGSLEDGLSGNATTLYAKSILDGTTAIFFTATLGPGVFLSALTVGIYQGSITLLARSVQPLMNDLLISQMSLVGSVLIAGIGFNFLSEKKIPVANLLPAVFIPILFQLAAYYIPFWPF